MCFCKKEWFFKVNIMKYQAGILMWYCMLPPVYGTILSKNLGEMYRRYDVTNNIRARAQPSTNSWICTINSSHTGVDMNEIEVAFSWKIIEEFCCYFNHMTLLAYWFEKYTLEVTAIFSSVFTVFSNSALCSPGLFHFNTKPMEIPII